MNTNLAIKLAKYVSVSEVLPALDFEHSYIGFGTHPSKCNVKVWVFGMYLFVLFTDLGKGTSVTNASEQLVTEVYSVIKMQSSFTHFDKKDYFFAETYEGKNEGVDLVIPVWKGETAIDVDWQHIGIKI